MTMRVEFCLCTENIDFFVISLSSERPACQNSILVCDQFAIMLCIGIADRLAMKGTHTVRDLKSNNVKCREI